MGPSYHGIQAALPERIQTEFKLIQTEFLHLKRCKKVTLAKKKKKYCKRGKNRVTMTENRRRSHNLPPKVTVPPGTVTGEHRGVLS